MKMNIKMKSLIFCGIVLSMVFMPFTSFAGPVIVGERVEFTGVGDIAGEPHITMRVHFRVEAASVNLSRMEYRTNPPPAVPPPTIVPVPGSGTFAPGSHVVSLTYHSRDASGIPHLPPRRICFDIWAHFQDPRLHPLRIISDACLETFMRLTSGGTGRRVAPPVAPTPRR
jgi:hypothetical protein